MSDEKIEVSKEILAAPEAVWRVITDLDAAAKVMRKIVSVERVEGEGYAEGVRWRETRRMFGKDETEEMWVAAVDEPRSTTVRSRAGGALYTTVFTLEPSDLGVTLDVSFSAATEDPGLGQRLMLAVFGKTAMKATKKALAEDLDDIAKVAEGRG
ncbi:SRPBCC family protein [Demequina sp. NBRC 110057]|uniref:SRPBCC family protein n=1 Tax=Demequina sp. NBRC 110057 TaxID=1570346 RepID=UPI000A0285D1|nr:SRPBCC family protein [Demequina sp. NBRC 110057]